MRQASSTSGTCADISRGMLGAGPAAVKPAGVANPAPRPAICKRGRSPGRLRGRKRRASGLTLILLLTALAVLAAAFLLHRRIRLRRHQRAMAGVLDAADALESRLRAARSEIEAVAGEGEDPVREALQEMLRQRLWLQQHGASAAPGQLDAVRTSIDGARERIDQQLLRIERARTAAQ